MGDAAGNVGTAGASRSYGDVLGGVLFAGAVASLVSARLIPLALLGAVVAGVLIARRDGRLRTELPGRNSVEMALAALTTYAFASTMWAEQGHKAISKLAFFVAILVGTAILVRVMSRMGRREAIKAARGLVIGFSVGLAFLLIELASGQAIQIFVYNLLDLPRSMMQPERHFSWAGDTLIRIEPAHINRNLAVAALLAFPVSLAAHVHYAGRWKLAGPAAMVSALVAASLSRHESSIAALTIGCVILGIAWASRRWASRMLRVGWIVACLGVVPLVMFLHHKDVHGAPWLQHSLRHRIVIWNTTAEEVLKAPILGIGAYMTYVLMPGRNAVAETDTATGFKKTFSRHAHNAYLQTWLELGLVGALLLCVSGLTLLGAISRLATDAQPVAMAAFAASATMMSSSYGIWQSWYLALFGFAAIATMLAAAAAGPGENGAAE